MASGALKGEVNEHWKMRKSQHPHQQQQLPRPAKLSIVTQDSNTHELSQSGGRRGFGGFERPLIAVPFDWEDKPGVPKRLQQQQQKSSAASATGGEQEKDLKLWSCNKGVAVAQSLAPPPRLMMLSSLTRNSDTTSDHLYLGRAKKIKSFAGVVNSPRSPRSISLSRKMKSLLQGKLHSSGNKSEGDQMNFPLSSSRSSTRMISNYPEDEYSGSISSNDIVFEGDILRGSSGISSPLSRCQSQRQQQQQEPLSPFKNMSNLLLELWYGGNSGESPSFSAAASGIPVEMISSSSSDLESPGSSTDNSLSSFSSDSLDNQQQALIQVPRSDREMKTNFDSYDESSLNDDEELLAAAGVVCREEEEEEQEDSEDDFSIDFEYSSSSSSGSKELKFCYKSDRFRVESYESASLLSSKQIKKDEEEQLQEQSPVQAVQPLPSALKKESSDAKKCFKKVRFVFEQAEEPAPEAEEEELCETEIEISPVKTSPVLSRYSSRPASRFNAEELESDEMICSPSPRTKRDLSQLFMQIIQADVELSQKQKGTRLKSMFRSRW